MEAGEEGGRSRPQMRRKPQIVGTGERIDAARLGDATTDRQVGLQNVDGAMGDQVAEVETGELALASGDRDEAALAHLCDTGLVVSGDRLLEPSEVAVAHQLCKTLGLGDREGAVSIDHDVDAWAQMVTSGSDTFSRSLGGPVHRADPHLDGLEATAVDIGAELASDPFRIRPAARG